MAAASAQTFAPAVPYAANAGNKLVRADFNNDGHQDLLTVSGSQGTILFGDGTGVFSRRDFDPGVTLTQLFAVDANGDGKVDIIGVSGTSSAPQIAVLLGNGDGTFQPARLIDAGTKSISIAVADFNRDGKIDIAAGSITGDPQQTPPPNTVSVYYGDGTGNFALGLTMNNVGIPKPFPESYCTGYQLTQISATDLNGDGWPDIAFIAGGAGCDVELGDIYGLYNNGNGTFTGKDITGLSVPRELGTGDYDQNGAHDLAVPYSGCHTPCQGLNLYLNPAPSPTSTLSVPLPTAIGYAESSSYNSPVIADFNNDGRNDVVYGLYAYAYGGSYNGDTYGVAFATQNADGTLAPGAFLQTQGGAPSSIVVGDFNEDGKLDVAGTLGGQVFVWLNTTADAQACAPGGDRTIHVCSPGTTSSTDDVRFLATPRSNQPISGMKVYVDNVGYFATDQDRLSARLKLSAGSHNIVVKAWDTQGPFSTSFTLNVTGTSGGSCPAGADRTVNLCSPQNGATLTSPVKVLATARSDQGLSDLQLYIDYKLVMRTGPGVSTIDQDVIFTSGTHFVEVKGWDKTGAFSSSASFTVSGGSSGGCTATADRTVNICQPANGSSVGSPVRVLAGLRSDAGIVDAQIYVDSTLVYHSGSATSTVDQSLSMSAGTHRITVKGWDKYGAFSSSVTISVTGNGQTTCTTSTDRSVNLCQPADGATVSSPVRVYAALRSSAGITAAQIYLDGSVVWQGPSGTTLVDKSLTIGVGSHRITVKGWDKYGSFMDTANITVQ